MNRLQQLVAKFNSNDEITLKQAISHVLDLANPDTDSEIFKPILRYLDSKVGRSVVEGLTSDTPYCTVALPTQKENNGGDVCNFNQFNPSRVQDFDIWEVSFMYPDNTRKCDDTQLLAGIVRLFAGITFDLNELAEDAICIKPYCDEAFGLIYCVMAKLREFGYIKYTLMSRSKHPPLKDKRYGETLMAMLESGWQNPRSVFLKGLVAMEDLIQILALLSEIVPEYVEHAVVGTTVDEMGLRLDKHMNYVLRQTLCLTPEYMLDTPASSRREDR